MPGLALLLALVGLVAGAVAVFAAPRLVAYRLPQPPPLPPVLVLVPIAGVVITRWRVRSSLAMQASCAAVLVALAAYEPNGIRLALGSVYSLLLLTIAYIDIDFRLVLNRLSYPGILLALAGSTVWSHLGIVNALLGAVVGLLFFGVLQVLGRGALGTGDTKLAVLIGAMRGFPAVLSALLLGILLGGLAALIALVVLRRGRKQFIAYAPYLSVGAVLSFFLVGP